MNDMTPPVGSAAAPKLHPFEFRGSGSEFFRIWIVNIALTLVTIGIYSAWAKVRTRRYFYGSTLVAGHAFDYHASPVRILVGRLIAVALFVAYTVMSSLSPLFAIPWVVVFIVAAPWLIVSSVRFNARNTSYRNVRFNFTGRYWGAFKAFILWPLAGAVTLGILMPLAHKRRDYYYVNHHTFGGKSFATSFSTWSIYAIYLFALAILVGSILFLGVIMGMMGVAINSDLLGAASEDSGSPSRALGAAIMVAGISFLIVMIAVSAYLAANVLTLVIGNTKIDGRHQLGMSLSPWQLVWIGLTNLVLVLMTIGLFYPWARVRMWRYLAGRMSLLASSQLDEYSSEAFATQNAIGEEVAGLFDVDIGI
jgi:uncharacterized membrane protein YjgN (DUF898 family)